MFEEIRKMETVAWGEEIEVGCKARFTSECERCIWMRGKAKCMVHSYTVRHSPRKRINPT